MKPRISSLHIWTIMNANVAAGVLAAVLSLGGAASHATTIVLRPDGSGDVPTFQAGVDRLMGINGPQADLLQVEAGFYDEDVLFDFAGGASCHGAIVCSSGPGLTRVRRLSAEGSSSNSLCNVQGLEVVQNVDLGGASKAFTWQDCRFLSDVESRGNFQQVFQDCEFYGHLRISGGGLVQESRFVGGRASLQLTFGLLHVRDCVFEQIPDTAAFATPGDNSSILFEGCAFRSVGSGIIVNPYATYGFGDGLRVTRCVFEDVAGVAIGYDALASHPGASFEFDVRNSRFERCGTPLRVRFDRRVQLVMQADTLLDSRENGIDASALLSCALDSLVVRRGDGAGIALAWPEFTPWPLTLTHAVIEDNAGDGVSLEESVGEGNQRAAIRNSTIARNGGAGVRARATAVLTDNLVLENVGPGLSLAVTEAEGDSVLRNTLVGNGGPGLVHVAAPEIPAPAGWIENNLVVGNLNGIVVEGAFDGIATRNDAWNNQGSDYLGIGVAGNLIADPLFCDAGNDDLRLAANSPCAPAGAYGQIGALGVGCDAQPVAVDTLDDFPALSGVIPNPVSAARDVTIAFTLPRALPASIDLLDAAGRRITRHDLGTPAAGEHRLKLRLGRIVTPGIYWVRVVQGDQWASSKVSVLP